MATATSYQPLRLKSAKYMDERLSCKNKLPSSHSSQQVMPALPCQGSLTTVGSDQADDDLLSWPELCEIVGESSQQRSPIASKLRKGLISRDKPITPSQETEERSLSIYGLEERNISQIRISTGICARRSPAMVQS